MSIFHHKHHLCEQIIKPHVNSPFFLVKQLVTSYNFPTGTGSGKIIGIIELGGGLLMSDVVSALQLNGISTMPSISIKSIDGAQNTVNVDRGADIEVALDVQIIAAIVPNSSINVYFAKNSISSFLKAISQAVTDNCTIISISWGAPEANWPLNSMNSFNSVFQAASNKGVTVFVASGDQGSGDGLAGNNVDFPASSPYVVACGGTSLILDSDNKITSETVWNNSSNSSTGGGFSRFFSRPVYQNTTSTNTKRGVPDISACADPNTGYIVIVNGEQLVVGGTSAVSPLMSGLLARLPSTPSSFNNILYSNSVVMCRDITIGNNGAYSASKGWDPVNGNGSPIASTWSQFFPSIPATPIDNPTVILSSTPDMQNPLKLIFQADTTLVNPTYTWFFGDGTSKTTNRLNTVIHQYAKYNTYTATVHAVTAKYTIVSNPLTVTINALPEIIMSLSRTFTLNTIIPNQIYTWSFGDKTPTVTGTQVSHTYLSRGMYRVSCSSASGTTYYTVVL